MEILALRNDTQKRVKAYKAASGEVKQLQQIMLAKNREQEEESKRARQQDRNNAGQKEGWGDRYVNGEKISDANDDS